jgi:hypothetical protein
MSEPIALASAFAGGWTKRGERCDDLGAKPTHRLQDVDQTFVADSFERLHLVLDHRECIGQARLRVNVQRAAL